MSDFFNLYPYGLPIHNPQWNVPQQPNYESEWLARLVGLEAERDAAVKRAETAEAQLGKEIAVSLIHARENDVLSAALREQRQRAEAAEAKLAAIPWGAIALIDTYTDNHPNVQQAKDVSKAWRAQNAPLHLRA